MALLISQQRLLFLPILISCAESKAAKLHQTTNRGSPSSAGRALMEKPHRDLQVSVGRLILQKPESDGGAVPSSDHEAKLLGSWKEIAAYLGKGVRTD